MSISADRMNAVEMIIDAAGATVRIGIKMQKNEKPRLTTTIQEVSHHG